MNQGPLAGVWMLRYRDDDNCDGDPISIHVTKAGAEAERARFGQYAKDYPVEFWPLMP